MESKIVILFGVIFAIGMNVWSLVLAWKAYKVNLHQTSTVSLTTASRRTMLTVKKLQKTTLFLTALISIPMLLHIGIYILVGSKSGAEILSMSTRKVFMYIGRTYVFTISINTGVFLYNHVQELMRKRVDSLETSTVPSLAPDCIAAVSKQERSGSCQPLSSPVNVKLYPLPTLEVKPYDGNCSQENPGCSNYDTEQLATNEMNSNQTQH